MVEDMDILEILKAVLFGVVEGITEWLPISSTEIGRASCRERVFRAV